MNHEDDAGAARALPEHRPDEAWFTLLLDEDPPTLRRDVSRPHIIVGDDAEQARKGRASMASVPDLAARGSMLPLPPPVPPPRTRTFMGQAPTMSAPLTVVAEAPTARSSKVRWLVIGGIAGVVTGIVIAAYALGRLGDLRAAAPAHAAPPTTPIEPRGEARPPAAPASSVAVSEKKEAVSAGSSASSAAAAIPRPAPASSRPPGDVDRPRTAPPKAAKSSSARTVPAAERPASILDEEL